MINLLRDKFYNWCYQRNRKRTVYMNGVTGNKGHFMDMLRSAMTNISNIEIDHDASHEDITLYYNILRKYNRDLLITDNDCMFIRDKHLDEWMTFLTENRCNKKLSCEELPFRDFKVLIITYRTNPGVLKGI